MITTGKYSARGGRGRQSVDARLQHLQRLREQGLVGPEEYERKKADILKDL
jgi:hypothetical protein